MTEKKSVQKKINDGEYTSKLPWVSRRKDVVLHEAYRTDCAILTEKFRADCLEELDRTNHPRAELLWAKAWEMGHANGLSDIWFYMRELDELLG